MDEKISKLLDKSKQVIEACSLSNGALVAANCTDPDYPADAKHYFYVWPRDGAYDCVAADLLGMKEIQEDFFNWVNERAEAFDEKGLLYEKYYVNGLQALARFQPDQGASLIWAIWHHTHENETLMYKYRELATKLAGGICDCWTVNHFKMVTNDLWEERLTFPDIKDNFSYSVAACVKALRLANEMFPDGKYVWIANEMEATLISSTKGKGYFYRSYGLLNDERVDASLLGLIWPFEIVKPEDELATATVDKIINDLVKNDGLHRYEHDDYDGWMYRMEHRKKGAGYWPLLNFWLAIVLSKMGRKDEALKYYYKVVDNIDLEKLEIPEQIFDNNIQKSVSPLCWSHSMFILATKELGLME